MFSDDQLIYMYRQGDETAYEYLLKEYSKTIEIQVRTYKALLRNMAFDQEECYSLGLGCFMSCVESYCASKNASFKTYFNLRLNYTIMNYRDKLSKKYKNELEVNTDEDYAVVMENLKSNQYCFDPSAMLFYNMTKENSDKLLSQFVGLEYQVAKLYLEGKDYKDMCELLENDHKAISNALYRVRQKLRNSSTLI